MKIVNNDLIGECYPNIYVIDSIDFVSHLKEFYEDGFLHPNDLGFIKYAENLSKYVY